MHLVDFLSEAILLLLHEVSDLLYLCHVVFAQLEDVLDLKRIDEASFAFIESSVRGAVEAAAHRLVYTCRILIFGKSVSHFGCAAESCQCRLRSRTLSSSLDHVLTYVFKYLLLLLILPGNQRIFVQPRFNRLLLQI